MDELTSFLRRCCRQTTVIATAAAAATAVGIALIGCSGADQWADIDVRLYTPTVSGAHVQGRVIRIVDGDTIRVSVGGDVYTVRYIGIDCPETKHPSLPVQWMGPEATRANEELVRGKKVYLEKDVSETDRYGRLLRYVFLDDGTFVNAELVRRGYAQVATYPPDVKYQDLFLEMQVEAREAGRGLWGPTPTPLPVTPAP